MGVVILRSVKVHEIQRDRPDNIQGDKRCEEEKSTRSTPIPENEEQAELLYETGRPEQEIQTCEMHSESPFQAASQNPGARSIPGFPTSRCRQRLRMRFFLEKNRTMLISATVLDRKSGERFTLGV
jgi:hypothetical protein